jgi:signal transduction histidine kinase
VRPDRSTGSPDRQLRWYARLVLELVDQLQAATWFVCSEALANVARHSGASSARVEVALRGGELRVEVRDDGRGGAALERGLRGLEDRVEALGGAFWLESPRGGPTTVGAALPLGQRLRAT